MRRPRHLSPDERALWDRVARSAEPMRSPRPREPQPAAQPPIPSLPPKAPVARFRIGERVDHSGSDDLIPGLAQRMTEAPVRMDSGTMRRMKSGKLQPEARIDLHGMTLSEAHGALTGFVLSAHAAGLRLVLVITGKGRARDAAGMAPPRPGALRQQVPDWLRLPPLGGTVLQVTPAHRRHGGEGAYYVYLRRRR